MTTSRLFSTCMAECGALGGSLLPPQGCGPIQQNCNSSTFGTPQNLSIVVNCCACDNDNSKNNSSTSTSTTIEPVPSPAPKDPAPVPKDPIEPVPSPAPKDPAPVPKDPIDPPIDPPVDPVDPVVDPPVEPVPVIPVVVPVDPCVDDTADYDADLVNYDVGFYLDQMTKTVGGETTVTTLYRDGSQRIDVTRSDGTRIVDTVTPSGCRRSSRMYSSAWLEDPDNNIFIDPHVIDNLESLLHDDIDSKQDFMDSISALNAAAIGDAPPLTVNQSFVDDDIGVDSGFTLTFEDASERSLVSSIGTNAVATAQDVQDVVEQSMRTLADLSNEPPPVDVVDPSVVSAEEHDQIEDLIQTNLQNPEQLTLAVETIAALQDSIKPSSDPVLIESDPSVVAGDGIDLPLDDNQYNRIANAIGDRSISKRNIGEKIVDFLITETSKKQKISHTSEDPYVEPPLTVTFNPESVIQDALLPINIDDFPVYVEGEDFKSYSDEYAAHVNTSSSLPLHLMRPPGVDDFAWDFHVIVNAYRATKNLEPLGWNRHLTEAAGHLANSITDYHKVSHNDPEFKGAHSHVDRARSYGYGRGPDFVPYDPNVGTKVGEYSDRVVENVAPRPPLATPFSAFESLLRSGDHRRNMEQPYLRDSGVAVSDGSVVHVLASYTQPKFAPEKDTYAREYDIIGYPDDYKIAVGPSGQQVTDATSYIQNIVDNHPSEVPVITEVPLTSEVPNGSPKELEFFNYINRYGGGPSLMWDNRLYLAALEQARHNDHWGIDSHGTTAFPYDLSNPGSSLANRAKNFGFSGSTFLLENVTSTDPSLLREDQIPKKLLNNWVGSDVHNANLKNSYLVYGAVAWVGWRVVWIGASSPDVNESNSENRKLISIPALSQSVLEDVINLKSSVVDEKSNSKAPVVSDTLFDSPLFRTGSTQSEILIDMPERTAPDYEAAAEKSLKDLKELIKAGPGDIGGNQLTSKTGNADKQPTAPNGLPLPDPREQSCWTRCAEETRQNKLACAEAAKRFKKYQYENFKCNMVVRPFRGKSRYSRRSTYARRRYPARSVKGRSSYAGWAYPRAAKYLLGRKSCCG